jgi:hypothetical protein
MYGHGPLLDTLGPTMVPWVLHFCETFMAPDKYEILILMMFLVSHICYVMHVFVAYFDDG